MKTLILVAIQIAAGHFASGQFQFGYYSSFPQPFYQQSFIPQPLPTFYSPPAITNQFLRSAPLPQLPILPQTNLNQAPSSNNYRGFGYHTSDNTGATSTVVFFTGAASDIRNIPNDDSDSITVASDFLDPQSARSIQDKINDSLQARTAKASTENSTSPLLTFPPILRTFFENPQALGDNGVVHFYSAPGFPANTAPLARALNNTTEEPTTTAATEEHELAESMVEKTSVEFKESKPSTEASTQSSTTSDSSEASSTTEKASETTEKAETTSTTVSN